MVIVDVCELLVLSDLDNKDCALLFGGYNRTCLTTRPRSGDIGRQCLDARFHIRNGGSSDGVQLLLDGLNLLLDR
uniref:Uncharacterized protein n=1 Tax=Daphnia galeata TaxID=27404 RepID=A0A8J2WMH6_9CRUS|nr:unnamed protein product [Daphnia galeata]